MMVLAIGIGRKGVDARILWPPIHRIQCCVGCQGCGEEGPGRCSYKEVGGSEWLGGSSASDCASVSASHRNSGGRKAAFGEKTSGGSPQVETCLHEPALSSC